MTEKMYSSYFNYFTCLDWQAASSFEFSDEHDEEWLQEQRSLSQLFAQRCHSLTAQVIRHDILSLDKLTEFQKSMLQSDKNDQEFLLREVILSADGDPWLLGSTLIPRSSLTDEQFDLSKQGEVPLGLTVFQAEHVARDGLHLSRITTPIGELAARSSRLWMNKKPMLVAELFLPPSPIYRKE